MTLSDYISKKNADGAAWAAAAPAGEQRWAAQYPTDAAYWAEYDIYTPEDFDAMLAAEEAKELRKAMMRGDW